MIHRFYVYKTQEYLRWNTKSSIDKTAWLYIRIRYGRMPKDSYTALESSLFSFLFIEWNRYFIILLCPWLGNIGSISIMWGFANFGVFLGAKLYAIYKKCILNFGYFVLKSKSELSFKKTAHYRGLYLWKL